MQEVIDINSLTQTQYENLYKSAARALHTLRKFITIESVSRCENGKTVLKIKRKGAFYPYKVVMQDNRFEEIGVII